MWCLDFQATESEMTNVCGVKPLDWGWFIIHPWYPLQPPTRLKVNRYLLSQATGWDAVSGSHCSSKVKEENLYLQVEERRS